MLSIITVTYKDIEGLNLTLKSIGLFSKYFDLIELIIVSGDDETYTLNLLNQAHLPSNTKIIYNINSGIFSAMNVGISNSSCKYMIFMNGGDSFYLHLNPDSIFNLLKKDIDVYLFQSTQLIHPNILKLKPISSSIFSTLPTRHQSIIFKRVLPTIYYNLNYNLSSDFDFYLQYMNKGSSVFCSDYPLCTFDLSGISNKLWHSSLLQSCSVLSNNNYSISFISLFYIRNLCANIFFNYFSRLYSFFRFQ